MNTYTVRGHSYLGDSPIFVVKAHSYSVSEREVLDFYQNEETGSGNRKVATFAPGAWDFVVEDEQ